MIEKKKRIPVLDKDMLILLEIDRLQQILLNKFLIELTASVLQSMMKNIKALL